MFEVNCELCSHKTREEDTDITLIDINPDKINEITDEVDAMGVVGNGASIKIGRASCRERV